MNSRVKGLCTALAAIVFIQSSTIIAEEPDREHNDPTSAPTHKAESTPTARATEKPSDSSTAVAATKAPSSTPAPQTEDVTSAPTPSPSPSPTPSPTPKSTEAPDEEPGKAPTIEPNTSVEPSDPQGTEEPTETPETVATPCPEESDDEPKETETAETDPTPVPITEDQVEEDKDSDDKKLRIVHLSKDPGFYGGVPCSSDGMQIPLLFQGDYSQTICYIGNSAHSVATSGCGATSVSMVIAYLTGNTQQTPYSLFLAAVEEGRYHGNGLDHGTLSSLAGRYGVHTRWISNSPTEIVAALESGKPVIAHMGPGLFTNRGHYIVLRGVTDDGLILVNDPNSRKNSRYAYPIETIVAQARGASSFMVCWTDDAVEEMPETDIVDAATTSEPDQTIIPETEPTETPEPEITEPEPTETPEPENAEPEPTETPEPENAEPEPTETPEPEITEPEPTETPEPEVADPEAPDTSFETGESSAHRGRILYSTSDHVLIRSKPGTEGRMLATLVEAGTPIEITDKVENAAGEKWYKVHYAEENVDGYIRVDLLTAQKPVAEIPTDPEPDTAHVDATDTDTAAETVPGAVNDGDFEEADMYTIRSNTRIYADVNENGEMLMELENAGTMVHVTDLLLAEDGTNWYAVTYKAGHVKGYIRADQLTLRYQEAPQENTVDSVDEEATEPEPMIEEPVVEAEIIEVEEIESDEPMDEE